MTPRCVRFLAIAAFTRILAASETGSSESLPNAKDYTELASKFGPFAFAVLFGFLVLWLIRGARKAAESTEAKVQAQARNYWVFSIFAGIACCTFATVGTIFWWGSQSTHLFAGQLKDLKTYEEVDGDDFYLKKELKPVLGSSTPLYNLHFIVKQAQPFTVGQRFEIGYSKKDSVKRQTFELSYEGDAVYRFEYDDLDVPLKLTKVPSRVDSSGNKNAAVFPFAAFAQTIPTAIPFAPVSAQMAQRSVAGQSGVDMRLVNLLQEGRTGVGAKIDLLDRLNGMDAATLKRYAEVVTSQEPFALTLIELSRHSDKELAAKARAVVTKSDAEAALARQLGSSKPEVRTAAEQAVFRVAPDTAQRILKLAPPSAQTQRLTAQVRSGDKQQVLTAVGSEGGDRYYVKANWDPKNRKTVECLAEAFHKELTASRSVQDEQKQMAGKSERLVYWYTKDWALSMADMIRACGATASFPVTKR